LQDDIAIVAQFVEDRTGIYANLACVVFALEIWQIEEKFRESKKVPGKLYGYLIKHVNNN